MTNDLRVALRQLRKSPGFAVTAILTLALGIGANSVVFGVLNVLVLRPVNVPGAQNLYMVQRFQYPSQSYPDYVDLRDREQVSAALTRSMRELDAGLPFAVKPWIEELDSALFAARVAAVALGVLGLLGAMLAVTGIFGMASYTVSKRPGELGIRMALGARRKQLLGAALGRAFILLSLGSAAGLLLGVLATKVLSYIVYQASPNDPVVLGGVVLSMLALGLAAAWIPAQRALSVDPMILLREE